MSAVWSTSADSASEPSQETERALAPVVILAAVIFNFALCFVDTNLFSIGAGVVVSTEIVLIGMAFGLIWYRSFTLYDILFSVTAYFFVVMVFRANFDPKIVHDLLIPIAFFFVGSYLGSYRAADRLVTILLFLALGASLFEWLALDTYLKYFNVIHYYVARGTETSLQTDAAHGLFITDPTSGAGLFINGTRFEPRTLLPFLGEHRVSGLFLEPVSIGNFGAIAFAWVLLRDRSRIWALVAKILAIATILVLADARFGFYFCFITLVIYLVAPIIRPTLLFLAPFLAMIALATYAGVHWQELSDNGITGRLLRGGDALIALDLLQVFGLQISDIFVNGYAGDAGYGYALVKIGLVGIAAIWALFIYAPDLDKDAWRFKNFIAFYSVSLLSVSASLFTIKTAALLWFLYGTLNNPNRAAGDPRMHHSENVDVDISAELI